MVTYSVSIHIDHTTEVINRALLDPNNFPYWQFDLERFEIVQGKPGKVGSVGRLHYVQKGKAYTMEDRLLYCDPGRKYVSKVVGEALTAQVETVLEPCESGTDMKMTWSGEGRTSSLKMLLPFLKSKMIKQVTMELETFKRLIESKGSDFTA